MYSSSVTVIVFLFVMLCALPAKAQPIKESPKAFGFTGLNAFSSLRTAPKGTIYGGLSTSDPYIHGYAGMQISESLAVTLRQTALISDLNDDADRLYPGTDIRWRLLGESTYIPETNLYMIAAIGHKRMASETLTFSKRIYDFDLTGGFAWGRLGSAAHFSNPFKLISNHFGRSRPLDSEIPNGPEDWFTGEDIGAFASLTYYPPLDGLSLTAEWGADRYLREAADMGYDAPKPWAFGIDYSPASWVSLGTALIGGNKIMGRVSLSTPIESWKNAPHKNDDADRKPMRPYRTGLSLPGQMQRAANMDGLALYDVTRDTQTARATLALHKDMPLPRALGRAATHMSNHAGEYIEAITVQPVMYGLDGPHIKVLRKDLENALIHEQGSPEEIWQNTEITEAARPYAISAFKDQLIQNKETDFDIILDNEISLSEEDNGLLYRRYVCKPEHLLRAVL